MAKSSKAAKKKKDKFKMIRFYGLNITIQSRERKGTKMYFDLIKRIYDDNIVVDLGGERKILFRNQFSTTFEHNNQKREILYGKLLRFTVIDTKNWYHQKNKLLQSYDLPADLAPNAFETDYIFIPDAHRFFIRFNNKVNIYSAKKFLEKAIRKLLIVDEELHVSLMASKDVIESILSAHNITNLTVNVSYTNDDIDKEAKQLIDKMLKKAHAGETEVNFKPDATGTLNSKSDLVGGFLGVAKENGFAIATTVDKNGKRKTIKTADYPEKISITVNESEQNKQDEKKVLFEKIMKEYRKDE